MKFLITLLSYPALAIAYFLYPQLHQFDWKWLLFAFFIYSYLILRYFSAVVESPGRHGFGSGRSGDGGMDGGGYFGGGDVGGGDCGGGGDC